MNADPTLTFGKYKHQKLRSVPEDYLRWLASGPTDLHSNRPGLPLINQTVIDIAREMVADLDASRLRQEAAKLWLGGHPTDFANPVYVIECEGDCYSKSGSYAIDYQWFDTLDAALEYLATEFPIEESIDPDRAGEMIRSTPDPEDDQIVIWEILPSGHRRIVWGFFGWHHSVDEFACGQGKLPGDDRDLYSIACADL